MGGAIISIGKSQFLRNQTSIGPETSLKIRICPLWYSEKKTQGTSLKARGLIEDISNEKENIIFQNY